MYTLVPPSYRCFMYLAFIGQALSKKKIFECHCNKLGYWPGLGETNHWGSNVFRIINLQSI